MKPCRKGEVSPSGSASAQSRREAARTVRIPSRDWSARRSLRRTDGSRSRSRSSSSASSTRRRSLSPRAPSMRRRRPSEVKKSPEGTSAGAIPAARGAGRRRGAPPRGPLPARRRPRRPRGRGRAACSRAPERAAVRCSTWRRSEVLPDGSRPDDPERVARAVEDLGELRVPPVEALAAHPSPGDEGPRHGGGQRRRVRPSGRAVRVAPAVRPPSPRRANR